MVRLRMMWGGRAWLSHLREPGPRQRCDRGRKRDRSDEFEHVVPPNEMPPRRPHGLSPAQWRQEGQAGSGAECASPLTELTYRRLTPMTGLHSSGSLKPLEKLGVEEVAQNFDRAFNKIASF
jgi:hypothetical protein